MRLASGIEFTFSGARSRSFPGQSGAVLLEVILALILFVAAATILTSGMSSSVAGIERLRLNTHAADLAVSVFSELQMGVKSLSQNGQQPFPTPLEEWTWEAVSSPVESGLDNSSPFKRIEVIIRHQDPAVVYRLSQVVYLDESKLKPGDERPGISGF